MGMIRPNCRIQITSADLDFMLSALRSRQADRESLTRLVSDPDSLDEILDDDTLFQALLDEQHCLSVSKHLYFYVLVRHVLRDSGMENRAVADYVASILSSFSTTRRARRPISEDEPMDYLVDMLAAMQKADAQTRFMIRVHMGNHSLYMTGVFPGHVRYRSERKAAPNIKYYEEVGSMNFKLASAHQIAQKNELSDIFAELAESFHTARMALNDMSERLIFLDEPFHPLLLPESTED